MALILILFILSQEYLNPLWDELHPNALRVYGPQKAEWGHNRVSNRTLHHWGAIA